MTTEYSTEKVAELIADTRDHAAYMRRVWGDDAEVRDDSRLFDRLADALEAEHKRAEAAVSEGQRHYDAAVRFRDERNDAEAERDELRAVIAELRAGLDRFSAIAFRAETVELLSRIPEHDDKEARDE